MLFNHVTLKQSIKKSLLKGGAAAVLFGALVPSTPVAEANAPEINAEASMTIDFSTGQILQADNIDQPMGIASEVEANAMELAIDFMAKYPELMELLNAM